MARDTKPHALIINELATRPMLRTADILWVIIIESWVKGLHRSAQMSPKFNFGSRAVATGI